MEEIVTSLTRVVVVVGGQILDMCVESKANRDLLR